MRFEIPKKGLKTVVDNDIIALWKASQGLGGGAVTRQTVSSFCKILVIISTIRCAISPAVAGEREEYAFAYNLFQTGAYFIAKDPLKAFIQNYPQSEDADDARFLIGECALQLKEYDEAIQHYKQIQIDYPDSPLRLDAVRGTATAWFHQGRYEEAIKAYEKIVQQSDDARVTSHSLYLIGESYDNLGLYQKSGEYYDQVLTKYPQSSEAPDALYAKGWSLYRLKKYQAAHDGLTKFVEVHPTHYAVPEAFYRAAESLFNLGNWAKAQDAYQKVINAYQNDSQHQQFAIDAQFRLGECYFQQKLMEEAKNAFDLLLRQHGTSPIAAEAQYWIGEVLLEQKKYPEAIHEYQKVVNLYPRSEVVDDAQYGIAMVNFLQGDYAKARVEFKVVADNRRSDLADAARFRMGECFRLQREFNSAILNYKKVKPKSAYGDDALYGKATSAFELKDYPQTIDALNELLQSHPASSLKPYAFYQLGFAYFNQKAYQKSSQAFDRFLAENRNANRETAPVDEALFWKARARFELEDYPGTLQTCEQLLQGFPNSRLRYRAKFFIAESTYWSEQTSEVFQSARRKYQALLSEQPRGAWAEKCRYGIGWTHFSEATLSKNSPDQQKHYREAVKAWKEVLANHQQGDLADKTQYHIGIAYVNLKHYDNGIGAFDQVISGYPGSSWQDNARYQIGWTLYKQEKYPEAITAFNKMLNKHPGSQLVPKAIFGVANAYFKQGKFAQSIKEYQRVVDKYPNPIREAGAEKVVDLRPEAQYYIAESFYNLQNYTEAIRAYEKVIQHHPKSEWADDAQHGIATAYENSGQKEKAIEMYRTLIQKYPNRELTPDVQIQIGRFYYEDKDYKRAIAEFQNAINQYPNTPSAWLAQYNIGKCYIALGSYRQAIAAFERIDPRSEFAPTAAYEIGYAWYDTNNPNRNLGNAVKALLEVPEKYPKSSDVLRALILAGLCYQELVQWDKAIEVYRRILDDHPDSKQAEFAQLALGDTYRAQKKYPEAIKAYDVIREKGTERYPVDVVIDGVIRLAETQALMGKHNDAGATYLRVRILYKDHDPFRALQATVYAADAFAKAGDTLAQAAYTHQAKDEYENAIKFYESNVQQIEDAGERKKWDRLHEVAKSKLQQLFK